MSVEIIRIDSGDRKGTIGTIIVDGIVCCWSLELPWVNNEIDISCVPNGEYTIKLEWSKHFKMKLYELKDVPGRSECKFHIANYTSQIKGCTATGTIVRHSKQNGQYSVGASTDAFNKFMKMMGDRKEDTLTIITL